VSPLVAAAIGQHTYTFRTTTLTYNGAAFTMCFAGVIEQNLEWQPLFQNATSLSEIAGSNQTAIKEASNYLFEASRRYAKNMFRKSLFAAIEDP
jgi:hypothetical protein